MAVNNSAYDTLPVDELRRRSAINTAVAGAAMRATLDYVQEHRTSLIADQIEVFRRGAAGEPPRCRCPRRPSRVCRASGRRTSTRPTFPRAYVIPAGAGQRSAPAAARLVDHLLANDVRVDPRRATPSGSAGRTYAKGSYVVDMHQPKRGLANVLLADGRDISDKVSVMYDISGWSLGRLWGATVTTGRQRASLSGVAAAGGRAPRRASATSPRAGICGCGWTTRRRSRPSTPCSRQGVSVRRAADGSAIVPASARQKAGRWRPDVRRRLRRATKDRGVAPLRRTRVAAAVTPGRAVRAA